MQALIIHCHPEPRSFSAALKDVAGATLRRSGYVVEVSDLYAEGFDPAEGPGHYSSRADHNSFSDAHRATAWQCHRYPAR